MRINKKYENSIFKPSFETSRNGIFILERSATVDDALYISNRITMEFGVSLGVPKVQYFLQMLMIKWVSMNKEYMRKVDKCLSKGAYSIY